MRQVASRPTETHTLDRAARDQAQGEHVIKAQEGPDQQRLNLGQGDTTPPKDQRMDVRLGMEIEPMQEERQVNTRREYNYNRQQMKRKKRDQAPKRQIYTQKSPN